MRLRARVCLLAGLALGCGGRRALESAGAADAAASLPDPAEAQPTDASSSLSVDASSAEGSHADATYQRDAGAVAAPRAYRAISIALGVAHACALLEDHRVKCWGDNTSGQLGYGDNRNRGKSLAEMGDALPTVDLGIGRTATQLVAGRYTTCALLDDGHVKCWGAAGLNGQMSQIGDEPGEMGDHLAPLPVPPGRTVRLIGAATSFPMAILDDGSGLLWSNGTSAAFSFATNAAARKIAGIGFGQIAVLFADGTVEEVADDPTDGASAMPLTIPGGGAATDVAGSSWGWCAAVADGHVACSFSHDPGITATDVVAVAVGLASSCVLTRSGSVGCLGLGASWSSSIVDGPALDGYFRVTPGEPATAIAASESFACALLASGGMKCWGPSDNCIAPSSPPPCDYTTDIVAGSAGGPFADGTFTWNDIDLGTFHPSPSE
jgi:hypothetical protein